MSIASLLSFIETSDVNTLFQKKAKAQGLQRIDAKRECVVAISYKKFCCLCR